MFLDKLKRSYLACLSIFMLSICSLMLLPIEGDCEWTDVNEGYSTFYDSYAESHGGGWTLSGSVSANACCASASMRPAISNVEAFNGAFGERVANYIGSATAEASSGAEYDYGDSTFLHAWVTMVKIEFMRVDGVSTTDPSLTLTRIAAPGDPLATVGAEWTSEGITYLTRASTKVIRIIPEAQPFLGVHAHIKGSTSDNKSASIYDFFFAGNGYDSADASYTVYDE